MYPQFLIWEAYLSLCIIWSAQPVCQLRSHHRLKYLIVISCLLFFKIYLCMRDKKREREHLYFCLCLHCVHAGAFKDQNSALNPLELDFQTVMSHLIWLLETVLWKSSTHCWTSPYWVFLLFYIFFFNVCDCVAYLYVCVRVCLVSTEATRYQIP